MTCSGIATSAELKSDLC